MSQPIQIKAVWQEQILRFVAVGITATLTHILVALLASLIFDLAPLVANLSGFSVAVAVSYWGHLCVTFRVADPKPLHVIRFGILSLVSLAASSMLTAICIGIGGSMVDAMMLVALAVPGTSFLAARLWVFAEPIQENGTL